MGMMLSTVTRVTITDMLGQSVYTGTMSGETLTVDIQHWQSGVYFVTLAATGSSHTARMVKW
jgi:hypothetical protein